MEIKMSLIYQSFNRIKLLLILSFFLTTSAFAQFSVGSDFVSRYIWRGFDIGESPSIQPTVEYGISGLAIGFWGAYPTVDVNTGTEEIDFYGSYSIDLKKSGSLSIGFTDYMFPTSTGFHIGNFNNYDGMKIYDNVDTVYGGSHYIEINAGYSGTENFPITLSFNVFVYNLENNPIYFEVGYSASVEDVGLAFFVGGTTGDDNKYYATDSFGLINVGLTASKEIKCTDDFSLPIFGSVIVNPETEDLLYVLGLSL
jgi:hypothetical protein